MIKSIDWDKLLSNVVSAISFALSLGIIYTVSENLRKRHKFKFQFSWSSGSNFYKKGSLIYAKWIFQGILKNQSIEPNTLTSVFLVVWKDVTRNSVLRFGSGEIKIKENDETIMLPIKFDPLDAKDLEITFDFPIDGPDKKIFEEANRLVGFVSRNWVEDFFIKRRLKKTSSGYELAFEDVNENLFDQYGNLRNRKEIDLWWTLSNYKGWRRTRELIKIYYLKFVFSINVFLRNVGIWA